MKERIDARVTRRVPPERVFLHLEVIQRQMQQAVGDHESPFLRLRSAGMVHVNGAVARDNSPSALGAEVAFLAGMCAFISMGLKSARSCKLLQSFIECRPGWIRLRSGLPALGGPPSHWSAYFRTMRGRSRAISTMNQSGSAPSGESEARTIWAISKLICANCRSSALAVWAASAACVDNVLPPGGKLP